MPDWMQLWAAARTAARRQGAADPEAMAQEAVLRSWLAGLDDGRHEQVQRGLVCRAARRLAIDTWRRETSCGRRKFVVLDGLEIGLSDFADEVAEALDREAVWPLVAQLPPVYRQAVTLRARGATYQQMAAVQGVCMDTFKGRLSYALRRLRKLARQEGLRREDLAV